VSYLQAASVASSTGSTIDGSSFSALLKRVEIGHMRIGSAGKGRINSRGRLLSHPTHRGWASSASQLSFEPTLGVSLPARVHSRQSVAGGERDDEIAMNHP